MLRGLRLEALRDAPQAFESTVEHEARLGKSDWLQRIERRAVAFASGRPVGLVGWSAASEGGNTELISMWVRSDARGTTTATLLVDFVKEIARSRGDTLELAVRADNARARRFYAKCGFVPVREEPGRLSGEPVVWMRLAHWD
jgi:ribosomal protein S18 acetylase RimI-like enzyme